MLQSMTTSTSSTYSHVRPMALEFPCLDSPRDLGAQNNNKLHVSDTDPGPNTRIRKNCGRSNLCETKSSSV
jgi:hypothetical protein